CSNSLGQILREKTIRCLALSQHGAAFGGGDMLGDAAELGLLLIGLAIVTQAKSSDERPVNDQIGVAADWRGEVGVAVEVQPEVAVVLLGVLSLGLAAKNHFRHLLDVAHVAGLAED